MCLHSAAVAKSKLIHLLFFIILTTSYYRWLWSTISHGNLVFAVEKSSNCFLISYFPKKISFSFCADLNILTIYSLSLARKFPMKIYLNLVWKFCQKLRISSCWQKLRLWNVSRSTTVGRKNPNIRNGKQTVSPNKNTKTISMPQSQISGKKQSI